MIDESLLHGEPDDPEDAGGHPLVVRYRLPPRSDGLVAAHGPRAPAFARRFVHGVGWSWAWTTACAFVFAWPASAVVARAVGQHPRGDAILWGPGGLDLLEFLGETEASRAPLRVLGLLVLLVSWVLGLVPLAAQLAALSFTTRQGRAAPHRGTLARALDAFPAFVVLWLLASVVELAIGFAGLFVSGATRDALSARASDPVADLAAAAVVGLFALLFATAGVVHDLARAAAIRNRVRAARALRAGLEAFVAAPFALFGAWAGSALLGWVPVGVVAAATYASHRGGTAPVVLLFLAHQGVLLARAASRTWWLGRCLR